MPGSQLLPPPLESERRGQLPRRHEGVRVQACSVEAEQDAGSLRRLRLRDAWRRSRNAPRTEMDDGHICVSSTDSFSPDQLLSTPL